MNLDQFVNKYYGQQLTNNHGNFKGECVSLAARYAQEVQGVPNADAVLYCSNTGGARDLYEQYDGQIPQYYDRVASPQYGDLVVWGANMGKYGDVAIYVGSEQVFGQLGTPVFLPAAVRHLTPKPLGYLRLKGDDMYEGQSAKQWHDELVTARADLANATAAAEARKLTPDEIDKGVKGILRREPTQPELANQDWANDPRLFINSLWNNGGSWFYNNPTQSGEFVPLGKEVYIKK